MLLTERELEKLVVFNMAAVAEKRKAKGLKLNFPEAVALITAAALEGAREGKTLEQVMASSAKVVLSPSFCHCCKGLLCRILAVQAGRHQQCCLFWHRYLQKF